MKNPYLVFFGLLVAVQLAVPLKMIADWEAVLANGRTYKFATAPVDPADAFRGRYIDLQFDASVVRQEHGNWKSYQRVYVLLDTDSAGFARVADVLEVPPASGDYVQAKVMWFDSTSRQLTLRYGFDRFYLNEQSAPAAEAAYREASLDSSRAAHALVVVKNGKAIVRDVLVRGRTVRDAGGG